MKAPHKRTIWILLTFFLLPVLLFGIWFNRQVRQSTLDHALIEAIKKNETQKAIALLDEGADANATDKPYQPKTLWSVLKEFWNRMKGKKSGEDTQVYNTALMLIYYPDHDPDMDVEPKDSPILLGALIEHGANVNVTDEHTWTPLFHACQLNHLNSAQVLLEHHANPNIKETFYGRTPFLTYSDNHDCARLLLKYKADVNATDIYGRTALIYASMLMFPPPDDQVRFLLEQGAKVSIKDNEGTTALDIARGNKAHKNIILLLEAAFQKELAEQHPARTATQ